jgi:hypothetical protein
VEKGDITLPDLVVFELHGEVAEGPGLTGQEDNPARLSVKAVDGKNPEPGITIDLLSEIRVGVDSSLKGKTEVLPLLPLDVQPGGLLHDEPAPARREDWNEKRIRCHHREKWSNQRIPLKNKAFREGLQHRSCGWEAFRLSFYSELMEERTVNEEGKDL